MRPLPSRLVAFVFIVSFACGGAQSGPAESGSELRTLPESRALGIVREALVEAGASGGGTFSVEVGAQPLEVDVALTDVPPSASSGSAPTTGSDGTTCPSLSRMGSCGSSPAPARTPRPRSYSSTSRPTGSVRIGKPSRTERSGWPKRSSGSAAT